METTEVVELIEKLGFPILMAFGLGAGIYLMMKWMMNTLMNKLASINEISIKLIDRVRALDNSIIRLETMIRVIHDLKLDWDRIGKLDHNDKRID